MSSKVEPAGNMLAMVRVGGQGGWFSRTFHPLGSLRTPVPGGQSRGQGCLGACVLGCPSPALPISQGKASSTHLRPPLPKAARKVPRCRGSQEWH